MKGQKKESGQYDDWFSDTAQEGVMAEKRHTKEFAQFMEDWKKHKKPWLFWQYKIATHTWRDPDWRDADDWDDLPFGNANFLFRRKPETIKIGDYNLPKPITKDLFHGTGVWAFSPEDANGFYGLLYDPKIKEHVALLKNGCLFEIDAHVLEWVKWWQETVVSKL